VARVRSLGREGYDWMDGVTGGGEDSLLSQEWNAGFSRSREEIGAEGGRI
jgi:hypothetical protein